MKETKIIKLTGFFSVRQYKKGVPRNEQAILPDGEQIAFIASIPFEQQPDEPAEIAAARPYGSPYEIRKEDGTVIKKLRLKIKIGGKYCQWYESTPNGLVEHRPTNNEMDGKKYQVAIKYVFKDKKNDNPLAASGMWANAVAFREIRQAAFDENPFGDDEDFSNLTPTIDPTPTQAASPVAPGETPEQSGNEKKNGDLPF